MGTLAQNTSKALASLDEKSHDQDDTGPFLFIQWMEIYARFEAVYFCKSKF